MKCPNGQPYKCRPQLLWLMCNYSYSYICFPLSLHITAIIAVNVLVIMICVATEIIIQPTLGSFEP